MRSRTTVLLLAVLSAAALALQGASAQTQRMTFTLQQAVALALERNRDVLIADQERYKADAQITEARSGAFPQLTLTGTYSRYLQKPVLFLPPNSPINPSNSTATLELGSDNSYLLGAALTQPLYSRKVGVAMEIAGTYHEYAEQSYRETTQDITLAVKRAYYTILLAQNLVAANREGLAVVAANLENVRSQHRNGTAAEFDLLRAEVELANTEPLVTSAENGLLLAENALKDILALPLDQPIELEDEFAFAEIPPSEMEQAERDALSKNPLMLRLMLQESMLEKNISIERANFFPTLNLIGAYQWQTQDNTFEFRNYNWAQTLNVGLQLSFPIFDGFKTSARAEEAEIDYQKIRYSRLKTEEGIKIMIQSARLKMAEAAKRILGQQKSIEQAQQAVRIAQTRFKSGVGTQLELLDTQVAMTRTRTNYARAVYEFLVAKAEWRQAVGLPD
jgi:outer membrane protein TolC